MHLEKTNNLSFTDSKVKEEARRIYKKTSQTKINRTQNDNIVVGGDKDKTGANNSRNIRRDHMDNKINNNREDGCVPNTNNVTNVSKGIDNIENIGEDKKTKPKYFRNNNKRISFCDYKNATSTQCYSWEKEYSRISRLYSVTVIEDNRARKKLDDVKFNDELEFLISFNPSDPDFPYNNLRDYNLSDSIKDDKYPIVIRFTIPKGYPKNNTNDLKIELTEFEHVSSIFNELFSELILITKSNLYPIYDALKLFDRRISEVVNNKLPSLESLKEKITVNWTKEEQKHLEEALCYYKYIKDVNKKWSEIAKHVGNGRTVKQCIDRYKYCRSFVLNNSHTSESESVNKISKINEDKDLNGEIQCNKSINELNKNMSTLKLNSYECLVLECDSFFSINTIIVAVLRLQIYCERCNSINEFRPITIPGNQNFNYSVDHNNSKTKSEHVDTSQSDPSCDDDSHFSDNYTKKESEIMIPNNIFDNLILGSSQNCRKCSIKHTIHFSPTLCHANNNEIGKIEFNSCYLRDILPIDVLISCSNCNCYVKLREFIVGKQYFINCRNCFKELNIKADSINLGSEVYNVYKSTDFLFDELMKCSVKDKKKKNKESKIPTSIGSPLPLNGICSHYKKSNRWMRFPCCNKAYPCHNCHDKENPEHVSEWANNMICGYCSREQTLADNCKYCKHNLIGNKGKSGGRFWEGGKGCRNAVTLSNRDSRKKKLLSKQTK